MFKIGQKVVCKSLKTSMGGTPFGIKLGKIYVIEKIINCPFCNEEFLCLVSVNSLSKKFCSGCNNLTQWSNVFCSWRFEPLKYDLIPNKLIIAEIIKEKIDTETETALHIINKISNGLIGVNDIKVIIESHEQEVPVLWEY